TSTGSASPRSNHEMPSVRSVSKAWRSGECPCEPNTVRLLGAEVGSSSYDEANYCFGSTGFGRFVQHQLWEFRAFRLARRQRAARARGDDAAAGLWRLALRRRLLHLGQGAKYRQLRRDQSLAGGSRRWATLGQPRVIGLRESSEAPEP